MQLFYQPDSRIFELDEEESRHCTKVLRLVTGDVIDLTDGKGLHQKCSIVVGGKRVTYKVLESVAMPRRDYSVTIAVAPTRKAERNEWMVEKMTEIGVEAIEFIVTEHTNRDTISRVVNLARLNRIAASAMKQSQQFFMPQIRIQNKFGTFLEASVADIRLIAYVPDNQRYDHVFQKVTKKANTLLLIGPEGDFSPKEVELATSLGFQTVSLGANRLRTETAAVAGCHAINLAQLVG